MWENHPQNLLAKKIQDFAHPFECSAIIRRSPSGHVEGFCLILNDDPQRRTSENTVAGLSDDALKAKVAAAAAELGAR